jgi:hypothetical protein
MATLEDFTTTQASLDEVLAFFDSLPPVAEDELLGEWDGGIVATGHPGEGQLDALRWAGKTFRGRDDVDPIVVHSDDGAREASDVMGAATIRMVEYRGTVTATMVYDRHPVFDHFRRVSEDTLLGVMDRKGEDHPLVFSLTRTAAPA